MRTENPLDDRRSPATPVLLAGVAATCAVGAWLVWKNGQPQRRYADIGIERRNPMNFFRAGNFPRRREIDRSGLRPLFERRQAVYDSY